MSSLFFDRFTDFKTEKNGGFRADPLAKYHRFTFFRNLFKDFHFCTLKYATYHLRTGVAAFTSLVYRCLSALLRTEKDKAHAENLREFTES